VTSLRERYGTRRIVEEHLANRDHKHYPLALSQREWAAEAVQLLHVRGGERALERRWSGAMVERRGRHMQCTCCGEPVIYGDRRCWHCDAPVREEQPAQRRMVAGLPVLPDDPSLFGSPVGRAGWGTAGSAHGGWRLPRAAQTQSLVSPTLPSPSALSRRGC